MYKDTVKFFTKNGSREAYPVLKGGKEETAIHWSLTLGAVHPITKRRSTSPGDVIEVPNLFNKVEVIGTASRGKGGKLFKCKLYLVGDTPELRGKHVVLDLRNEALFSIIQTSDLIDKGVFEGLYAISSMTGTYYISNLNNPNDPLTPEYEEYLSLEERLSEGEVVKNTLSLNDLIEGHIYTKVSKGLLDKRKYLYMGKVPFKSGSYNSPTKSQPVYFSLDKFYDVFNSCVVNGSNSEYWSKSLISFLRDRMLNGYVLESTFSLLQERGILLKTSNKFYEDITEETPFDMFKLVGQIVRLQNFRAINVLNMDTSDTDNLRNTKYLKERDSINLIEMLNKYDNQFYDEHIILYPLNRFKAAINREKYVNTLIKDMEFTTALLKNYLANFEQNENTRLNYISDIVEQNKKHYNHSAIFNKSLVNYKLSKANLIKALDSTYSLIEKLNMYKEQA